jgi:hypothetical protein
MANARSFDDSDELAHEIDRLLKQLPAAEPIVRAPPAYRASAATHAVGTNGTPARRASRGERSAHAQLALIWTRVLLAMALGVALTQWPYARACGWTLYGYLVVILAVLVAAGWAGVEAWRGRVASAHLVSLIIGFWGIVLAAEQVLPRVGYAAATAEWSCSAGRPGG